jgi:hypothetical protein
MSRMEANPRASLLVSVAGSIVLVGLAVFAGVLVTSQPETRTLAGVVTLLESEMAKFDRDVREGPADRSIPAAEAERRRCASIATEALVLPGQTIVLFDEEGRVLGRGLLGQVEPVRRADPTSGRPSMSCRLPFRIDAFEHAGNVKVEIGSRVGRTYTARELDALDWNLEVRVGR